MYSGNNHHHCCRRHHQLYQTPSIYISANGFLGLNYLLFRSHICAKTLCLLSPLMYVHYSNFKKNSVLNNLLNIRPAHLFYHALDLTREFTDSKCIHITTKDFTKLQLIFTLLNWWSIKHEQIVLTQNIVFLSLVDH